MKPTIHLPPAPPPGVAGTTHVLVLELSDCGPERRSYATARFSVVAAAPAGVTAAPPAPRRSGA
ncbi:hypothetical protein [Rugamonas sp. DEMB1]|uniref:hypothetical protein n=1 Tax=Rugamonas sp. DEMB1 TaxID=3039386 RepID=UPI00244684C9|nr:hypothetical protein [Rugamonas sp. DEMB1]WGG48847.1 hypothetical protein QC826_19645 [Rugamonas sp. DEMB1]